MKNLAIAGIALLIFTGTALAAELPVEALATKVVQLSGIDRALAALPETLHAKGDLQALTRLPGDTPSAGDAAIAAFDPEAATKRLTKYLAAHCDAGSLSQTLVWLESPTGLKLTAVEDAEKGLELQAGMLKYLTELKKTPPDPDRIVSIRKLAQVSGQLEMVAKTFQATAVRMASAMSGGTAIPGIEAFIRGRVKEAWAPLEKQYLQQLVATDLYIYRDISDAELASYMAFLESAAGKSYTSAVAGGYGEILEDLVMDSSKEMIEALKKQAQGGDDDEDEDACQEDGDAAVTAPAAVK